MAEHYTKATEAISKWCDTCRRLTEHAVSSGRIGRCKEHAAAALSRKQQRQLEKQERERRQPRLFE